jgi:IS30 family transposase
MPGDTDLASISQRDLTRLARHLNDQPRKCLAEKRQPKSSSRTCVEAADPLPCERRDALGLASPITQPHPDANTAA